MNHPSMAGPEDPVRPESARLDDRLPIIPVGGTVVFPTALIPLSLNDPPLVRAVQAALRGGRLAVLLSLRPGRLPREGMDAPAASPFYDVGTLARILQVLRADDGSLRALIQGLTRVDVAETRRDDDIWSAAARARAEIPARGGSAVLLRAAIVRALEELLDLAADEPEGARASIARLTDLSQLADIGASNLSIPAEEKQALLEERQVARRLERVLEALRDEASMRRLGIGGPGW